MQTCGMSLVKYMLFLFNFVFALAGIALLAVGIVIETNFSKYSDILDTNVSAPPIVLIVAGAIVFVIAFFGCCGAKKENKCLLHMFSFCLIVIFILEIVIGIVAFVSRDQLEQDLQTEANRTMIDYINGVAAAKELWDSIQETFECCGMNGRDDYDYYPTFPIPDSCQNYTEGCLDKVTAFVDEWAVVAGAVAIAIGVVELAGIAFSCCLTSSISKERRRHV